jgi:hypothetical protein
VQFGSANAMLAVTAIAAIRKSDTISIANMRFTTFHLLSSSRFPLTKTKPTTSKRSFDPLVAGCTTGSLNPRCPSVRDKALSLYREQPSFVCEKHTLKRSTMEYYESLINTLYPKANVPQHIGNDFEIPVMAR